MAQRLVRYRLIITVRYFAYITLVITILFELLRGLLLWRYLPLANDIPSSTIFRSFLVGFRFDLSIAGYIIAPAALISFIPTIGLIESQTTRRIVNNYLTLMVAVALFLSLADLEFFGQFNSRLNYLLIAWLDTPRMVLQMLWEMVYFIPYLLGWLLLVVLFYSIISRISRSMFRRVRDVPLIQQWLIYPFALLLIFGAIRGRIAIKAPLTWGVAYFSPHHFANQLALNSCFSFMRDYLDHAKQSDNSLLTSLTADQAYSNARDLVNIDTTKLITDHPIARIVADSNQHQLNVIVILMESFAADFVGSCNGRRSLAPEFDRIANEGILFTRFFASGGHTYTGVFSTTTGLPSLPGKSIMKRSEGQQTFSGLATILKGRNYNTRFYTTHDPHFDNMKGFLTGNGFDKIIGQSEYPADAVVSSLGVPDEVMFNRVLNDADQIDQPFFTLLLTGSAHGPYIHPDRSFPHSDPSDPDVDRFNAFSYADWALGKFYNEALSRDWGDNTIFVILGDHGVNWQPLLELELSLYRVPLLLVGPGVVQPKITQRVGGQPDITATVMDMLGGNWINNTLGQSLLNDQSGHALFIEGHAFGFVANDRYIIRNRNGNINLYNLNDLTPIPIESKDMTNNALTLLSATHYLITNRLVGIPK